MTVTDVEPLLEDSIDIAAPPPEVWALVTDLPRMAQWSPQVVKTIVRGGPVGRGTRTLNVNRRGLLLWPTRAEVVTFEPHRRFAFRIKDNTTVWSFTLEPIEGGTRLTERREAAAGVTAISAWLTRHVLGGQAQFTSELRAGIRQTLERIRKAAES